MNKPKALLFILVIIRFFNLSFQRETLGSFKYISYFCKIQTKKVKIIWNKIILS